mgnify:FL=1
MSYLGWILLWPGFLEAWQDAFIIFKFSYDFSHLKSLSSEIILFNISCFYFSKFLCYMFSNRKFPLKKNQRTENASYDSFPPKKNLAFEFPLVEKKGSSKTVSFWCKKKIILFFIGVLFCLEYIKPSAKTESFNSFLIFRK